MEKQLKIALPKGRLLPETAALLDKADWGLSGYEEGARSYRLASPKFSNLLAKIFHEKDIPIQVAVGNYDVGICGLDWVEELLARYPESALIKLRNLRYGAGAIYVAASRFGKVTNIEEIQAKKGTIRLASEYPNLAEAFALRQRIRQFRVFPVWGGAEVYPPEGADLALIPARRAEEINHDLVPVSNFLPFSACLIANRNSWETKDLSGILASIDGKISVTMGNRPQARLARMPEICGQHPAIKADKDAIRLALPDGHQQQPTCQLLNSAGIQMSDYPSPQGNRRPTSSLAGVTIKVIRPQDMPLQVANQNFDLAITGQDWLKEHLYQFPSSPVAELLKLDFGKVRIVAVVSNDLSATDADDMKRIFAERPEAVRVASEYTNIADRYARDNHLGHYRIIPTWGATEAFLPEDADLLIENTQTGSTIARHNLKIIETLFESTACLIGNKDSISNQAKRDRINSIVETLRAAV